MKFHFEPICIGIEYGINWADWQQGQRVRRKERSVRSDRRMMSGSQRATNDDRIVGLRGYRRQRSLMRAA
jgi:hypothetical protein